jgi:hypothetical protein
MRRDLLQEIEALSSGYRGGKLSRRGLAAAVSSAAAAVVVAARGEPAAAQTLSFRPTSQRTFVPDTVGGGADDFAALQGALDEAAASGGGQVIITGALLTGRTLTVDSGVELIGSGIGGSAIGAHPSFAQPHLISVKPESRNTTFQDLTLDTGGLCEAAAINLGGGCRHVRVSGLRLTGWALPTPAVVGVRCDTPTGSDASVQHISIDNCEFDSLGNGVKLFDGPSHVTIQDCSFKRIHRRAIWIFGSGESTSRHIRIVGNDMMDFPEDADMKNPISVGGLADAYHEHIHLIGNTVIGNGDHFGPGGFGTADHFSVHCARQVQIVCNTSLACGDTGFVLTDCVDAIVMGNSSVASDIAGFVVKAKQFKLTGLQFIGNYAQNNGINVGRQHTHPYVLSGFLLRQFADGIQDTHFLANRAWDDQQTKTQAYALVLEHDTIFNTLLTGNLWRETQHVLGTVLNRGRGTREALYELVPRDA